MKRKGEVTRYSRKRAESASVSEANQHNSFKINISHNTHLII